MRRVVFAVLVLSLSCVLACQAKRQPGDPIEGEPTPSHDTSATTSRTGATATSSSGNTQTADGYTVIKSKRQDGTETSVAVQAPPGMQVIRRPDADPHNGNFPLSEAVAGLPTSGKLQATIKTSLGTLTCKLFDDKAPNTVANFVGLARGLRKYWDVRQSEWVAKPYYDGTIFHRVIPDFMIQGGDYMGDGTGFTGYQFADELHPSLKHDRAGLLCMANRGPNTNATQFFITDAATPHLDNSYTIFGECAPVDIIARIARVPQAGPGNRPITPVVMERVEITRK